MPMIAAPATRRRLRTFGAVGMSDEEILVVDEVERFVAEVSRQANLVVEWVPLDYAGTLPARTRLARWRPSEVRSITWVRPILVTRKNLLAYSPVSSSGLIIL